MEIKTTSNDTPYVFKIIGRLDSNTSSKLATFIDEIYKKNVKCLVVDMEECDYISSAGLRVIVSMQKRASVEPEGSLAFTNVQPEVMEVFTLTGFNQILTLEAI